MLAWKPHHRNLGAALREFLLDAVAAKLFAALHLASHVVEHRERHALPGQFDDLAGRQSVARAGFLDAANQYLEG